VNSTRARILLAAGMSLASACVGREAGAPAGTPPVCTADADCPDGQTCDTNLGLCADAEDPCGGFACGGSERGTCNDDATCTCNEGYGAGVIDGLCCEVDGADALCNAEPAPGHAGGLCLAPDGHCDPGFTCNLEQHYCLSDAHPCLGFACGGFERGDCVESDGQPTCTCKPGYDNEKFALYCCPMDGSDPNCIG
jgi:Cys-rich repeat protein